MKGFYKAGLLILFMLLAGCDSWWSGKDIDDKNPFEGYTAKQLYTEAQKQLKQGQYSSAIKRLEAMETMYPFSEYAEDAQMQLIYAYYEKDDYPSSAATAERFIHLYPRAKQVDYAYYMKGLANFQQTRGTFSQWLPLDESWRDPGSQSQAYLDFATFIQKFPESKYKANALQRMIYLRNMFAQRELNTAKFYFDRQMYVAANERASYLVKNYPQAPSVKEALAIMQQTSDRLGLKDAALEAARVSQATYHGKQQA